MGVRLSSAAVQCGLGKNQGNDGSDMLKAADTSTESDIFCSNSVSFSTSNSELKLLRVLQMLSSLCAQDDENKSEGNPPEFVSLLQSLNLESLWQELSVW